VPTQGARSSIAELRRVGYAAELREYAGVEHDISDEEEGEILERSGGPPTASRPRLEAGTLADFSAGRKG
jgi:phospholipase/carboxylesterase